MPTNRRRNPLICAWCDATIEPRSRGRLPRWCSDSCRHRAWEQRRAAASGKSAIEIVERIVEVERPVEVVRQVEVAATPKGLGWAPALKELARQLDTGRLYDRDLPGVEAALREIIESFNRRSAGQKRR